MQLPVCPAVSKDGHISATALCLWIPRQCVHSLELLQLCSYSFANKRKTANMRGVPNLLKRSLTYANLIKQDTLYGGRLGAPKWKVMPQTARWRDRTLCRVRSAHPLIVINAPLAGSVASKRFPGSVRRTEATRDPLFVKNLSRSG